jgi:single-stranded-DNA-specific exonuclease
LLQKGGGHAMAAGFSVEAKHIPALQAFLGKRANGISETRVSLADGAVALSGLNVELAHMLERAAPFGQGNPAPRLVAQNVTVAAVDVVKEQHLRLILTDEGKSRCAAIAFRSHGTPFGKALQKLAGKKAHVLGTLKLRYWQGEAQASFTVEDAAIA